MRPSPGSSVVPHVVNLVAAAVALVVDLADPVVVPRVVSSMCPTFVVPDIPGDTNGD